jgi:hypothetical protein
MTNYIVITTLMDLSEAFDCLPHDLLLQKLKYYGTSKSALKLIQNYLSNRKQCVKFRTALNGSNPQHLAAQRVP